jgi:hypothetical protein
MVSDQYIQALLEKYIDSAVLNFKDDDIITALVEVEERPLFPVVDDLLLEQAETAKYNMDFVEVRDGVRARFALLDEIANKSKLSNLHKKMKSAHLAMALDESNKDNIMLDLHTMISKFFSKNNQNQNNLEILKTEDVNGATPFSLYQISPSLQDAMQKLTYKKIRGGKRKMFGVPSNQIVQGFSPIELAHAFDE